MGNARDDITGRRQMGWNVTVSWLGEFIVVVSGFLIPRLISDELDQSALGIWDFGWSTVSYFRFLGLGLAGSLNRYVALYRARDDYVQLRRAISSTSVLQYLLAAITVVVSGAIAAASNLIFRGEDIELAQSARWLIVCLGLGLATRMACWTARGILTGHHRWAENASASALGDILLLIVTIIALKSGGGLTSVGLSFIGTTLTAETVRVWLAKQVYKDAFLDRNFVDLKMIRKMFVFGIKTNVSGLPTLLVTQVVTLMLAIVSGPSALAIYARPLALTRHVHKIVSKFTNILTSTTASLQGLGKEEELKSFFLASTRTTMALAWPLLAIVGVYGDLIVDVWMGPEYVDPLLAPIFAAGMLLPFANSAAMRVLVGLNAHGRVAVHALIISMIVTLAGSAAAFVIGWTPAAAALIVASSLTLGPGIVVPLRACARLSLPVRHLLWHGYLAPAVCNIVFIAVIALPRIYRNSPELLEIGLAVGFGSIGLAIAYWQILLEPITKRRIMNRLRPGSRRQIS
jgi:O-antigen/teichoic acid export membrane protein